jgi:PhoPQ-activated pathogenicity-related protein
VYRYALALLFAAAPAAHGDLFDYLARPDDSFAWSLEGTETTPTGKIVSIHMTSQTWQDITWEHEIRIYEPNQIDCPDVMGMLITGGEPSDGEKLLGLTVANRASMRFAILYGIPNQPLYGGLEEDALIAYTWQKYLETGDETWPLQFPMVKSAVRAMDTLTAVAQQEWDTDLRGFMVCGASKRGWTTYLTGIADPDRVVAMAPMVFDILNLPVSVEHQKEFWGDYSEQIEDYTKTGLVGSLETPRGFRLAYMVDPYSYRDRLHMPKLIVLGSNDPYWPTDAVNLYWLGLPMPRWMLICPNSGHGLDDRARLLASLTTFAHTTALGGEMPHPAWDYTETPQGLTLSIAPGGTVKEARVWVAHAPVCDFRPAKWEDSVIEGQDGAYTATIDRTRGEWTACYGEVVYEVDGRTLYLSTQPRVMHPVAAD